MMAATHLSFRTPRRTAVRLLLLLTALAPISAPLCAQTASPRQPAPRNALVYFHYPLDGLRVPERFTVRIGLKEMGVAGSELPMSETEFRATLDPVAIVRNRATAGGPQPAEMARMIASARQKLATQEGWIKERRERIDQALAGLDRDFAKLVPGAN